MVTGRVASLDGAPLAGAQVDVWQADDHGFYDVQQPDAQPPGNGRGLFTCDADGRFWFRTVTPSPYPIPTDGPVGSLLTATGRHPYRPAHIHFIVAAGGHLPVTTHMFVAGSPYLDSDAVFAVKQSLIRDFAEVDDPEQAAGTAWRPPSATPTSTSSSSPPGKLLRPSSNHRTFAVHLNGGASPWPPERPVWSSAPTPSGSAGSAMPRSCAASP